MDGNYNICTVGTGNAYDGYFESVRKGVSNRATEVKSMLLPFDPVGERDFWLEIASSI